MGGTVGSGGALACTKDADCTGVSTGACHRPACSGGMCVGVPDDSLAPMDDGNACTTDTCVNGVETYTNTSGPCGSNPPVTHCENGKCTGCVTGADCGPKTECRVWSCSPAGECILTIGPTDQLKDEPKDCTKLSCSDTGVLIKELDTTDGPNDDGNECTKEECVDLGAEGGMAVHTPQEGQACGGGPTCSMGTAKEQDTCDAGGVCVTGIQWACTPYECGATACKTSCTGPADCALGGYCDTAQSKCFDKKFPGEACVLPEECFTGFCPADDGVCCNAACGGPCRGCYKDGAPGTCGNLPKGLVDSCGAGQACDGNGVCAGLSGKAAVGQLCIQSIDCFAHAGTGCVNNLCRLHTGETCDPAKPHECGTNLCDPATHQCKECTQNSDCPSMACNTANKRCYLPAGGICGAAADCSPGHTCMSNACQ